MMMLLILTTVLGYELKTAVGTSVFIMTFTALTGAISPLHHRRRAGLDGADPLRAVHADLGTHRRRVRQQGRPLRPWNRATGVVLVVLGLSIMTFNLLNEKPQKEEAPSRVLTSLCHAQSSFFFSSPSRPCRPEKHRRHAVHRRARVKRLGCGVQPADGELRGGVPFAGEDGHGACPPPASADTPPSGIPRCCPPRRYSSSCRWSCHPPAPPQEAGKLALLLNVSP